MLLPSLTLLLALTVELNPTAVAFVKLGVETSAERPRKVLLLPVELTPASEPIAVQLLPLILTPKQLTPTPVFCDPVLFTSKQ